VRCSAFISSHSILNTQAKNAELAKKDALNKKLIAAINSGDTEALTNDEITKMQQLKADRAAAAVAGKAKAREKMTSGQKVCYSLKSITNSSR